MINKQAGRIGWVLAAIKIILFKLTVKVMLVEEQWKS
jgi:hypothetical protein